MYNKYKPRSSRRISKQTPLQPFEISLTDFKEASPTPLSYSQSQQSPRVIALENLPHKDQVCPPVTDFDASQTSSSNRCNRIDCLDRKFKAIQAVNKSSPNIKAVSPHKKDIVFEEFS